MIPIKYEDEYCIIVNKPENVLVHHSYYARNIKDDSLLQLLRQQFLNQNFYPVHRLDRKTSGLLLLCKHKEDVHSFQNLFDSNKITKKYKALVRGFTNKSGQINTPIKNNETGIYKSALSIYKRLQTFEVNIPVKPYQTARYSLIEIEPKTGRTHQLRKHLNKIAHPIIGDHKYGNRHHNQMITEQFKIDNLFLQAFKLEFQHPILPKLVKVEIELPEFWANLFKDYQFQLSVIPPQE
ncbi:MAG: RluA family pseudouridine synthase [Putridiphycobacter sp.]